MSDRFWAWFWAALAALCLGAACYGALPAAASNSECHDHCCYDPMPGCVASKWLWFAARDRRCTPADGADTHGKAFLCYYDDAGEPQRFKFWGLVPLAEAEFEAEMRNAVRCRR